MAGKYAIADGKEVEATDASGNVVTSENGVLTLTPGEWTIAEVRAPITVDYYVKSGADGDGRTPETPARSVTAAIVAAQTDNELIKGDTINVYLIQEDINGQATIDADGIHNLPVWRKGGSGDPEYPNFTYDATVVVQPYDSNVKTYLAEHQKYDQQYPRIYIAGPTVFKDISIVTVRRTANLPYVLTANGFDFTYEYDGIDQCYALSGDGSLSNQYLIPLSTSFDGTFANDFTVTIKANMSANSQMLHLGSARANQSATYNGDFTYVLDHDGIGANGVYVYNTNNLTFNKNLNVKVRNVTNSSTFAGFGKGGTLTVNGAVQYMVAPGEVVNKPITYHFTETSTPCYTLKPDSLALFDAIEFTSVAGTYNITNGLGAKATNADGKVVRSEDRVLTLTPGEWTITTYDESNNPEFSVVVNYGTSDTATAFEGDTVTITADEPEAGKAFDYWQVISGGIELDDEYSAITTFVMGDCDVELRARYYTVEVYYDVTVENGTANLESATSGTTVTITADDAALGYAFAGWNVVSGGVTLADSSSATTTFVMGASDVSVVAVYSELVDDGATNVIDLVRLKKYLSGVNDNIGLYADYTKDGNINALDLTMLKKIILDLVEAPTSGAIVVTDGEVEINEVINIAGTDATDAVTVSGEGTIANIIGGKYDASDKDCAVWANGGATVNIYDGTFICDGLDVAATSDHHQDMIYAGSGSAGAGTINIYGGHFEARNSDGAWLLNENDKNGKITVYGGTFVNWNPADNVSEGANTNFVADGYTVIEEVKENGDVWYTVVLDQ